MIRANLRAGFAMEDGDACRGEDVIDGDAEKEGAIRWPGGLDAETQSGIEQGAVFKRIGKKRRPRGDIQIPRDHHMPRLGVGKRDDFLELEIATLRASLPGGRRGMGANEAENLIIELHLGDDRKISPIGEVIFLRLQDGEFAVQGVSKIIVAGERDRVGIDVFEGEGIQPGLAHFLEQKNVRVGGLNEGTHPVKIGVIPQNVCREEPVRRACDRDRRFRQVKRNDKPKMKEYKSPSHPRRPGPF